MKKKKTRYETSQQVFLNATDIMVLLALTNYRTAKRLYDAADQIDSKLAFRAETKKVRTTTVCKLAGVNLLQLQTQLKKADGVGDQSAEKRDL